MRNEYNIVQKRFNFRMSHKNNFYRNLKTWAKLFLHILPSINSTTKISLRNKIINPTGEK